MDTYLQEYIKYTVEHTSKAKISMRSNEYNWSTSLSEYKSEAEDKHIDISSCLGQNQKNLEQLLRINFQSMSRCVDAVNKNAESKIENTHDTVRFQ